MQEEGSEGVLSDELDVAIVGAGLSGLSCARELQERGARVALWDKGRGVGGRMATRRLQHNGQTATFDHGAQFFTARSQEFKEQVAHWASQNLAREWYRGQFKTRREEDSAEEFAVTGEPDGHPRFCGEGGMTSVTKHMARGLDVRTSARVAGLQFESGVWILRGEAQNDLGRARTLVLSPPVPQSLALLDASSVELPGTLRESLQAMRYDPCVALMLWLSRPTRVPSPGALSLEGEPLVWLGDNTQKGLCEPFALTIHAAPGWSERNYALSDEDTVRELSQAARQFWEGEILAFSVARWRFSKPIEPRDDGFLAWSERRLFFAGDAFNGAKVEGAFCSGLATARAIDNLE